MRWQIVIIVPLCNEKRTFETIFLPLLTRSRRRAINILHFPTFGKIQSKKSVENISVSCQHFTVWSEILKCQQFTLLQRGPKQLAMFCWNTSQINNCETCRYSAKKNTDAININQLLLYFLYGTGLHFQKFWTTIFIFLKIDFLVNPFGERNYLNGI